MIKAVLIGCLGLLVIGLVGAGLFLHQISKELKESPWCQQGFELACGNADVRDQLGTPIELGWLATGSQMIVRGGGGESGRANISVPIKGPLGKGRLFLKARMKDGKWEIEVAEIELHGRDGTISLLNHGRVGDDA